MSFVGGAVLAVLGFPFGSLIGLAAFLVGVAGVVTGLTYLIRGRHRGSRLDGLGHRGAAGLRLP